MLSGRLFTEIRDKRGLAYTAYSTVAQFVDGGVFLVYAGTQPSTTGDVEALLKCADLWPELPEPPAAHSHDRLRRTAQWMGAGR